jgi:hypothetical protein
MSDVVRRVTVEYELEDGTVKYVQCTDVVTFRLDMRPESGGPWDTDTSELGLGRLNLILNVTAKAAERSTT